MTRARPLALLLLLDTRIDGGAGAAAPILTAQQRRVFTVAAARGVSVRARTSNVAVQLARDGAGTIAETNNSAVSVHFILDVNGYFQ
jgi:hypothetical protein